MKHCIWLAASSLCLIGIATMSDVTVASAPGGGANLMNSPGYQRALEESRKRYRESYSQPYTQPPAVHPRKKKWRKPAQSR